MRHEQLEVTDLEERGASGDALQRASVDAASPVSLCNSQLSVAHHRGGREGVGVADTGAITGLRGGGIGGGGGGGQEVRMGMGMRRDGESEDGVKDETESQKGDDE